MIFYGGFAVYYYFLFTRGSMLFVLLFDRYFTRLLLKECSKDSLL